MKLGRKGLFFMGMFTGMIVLVFIVFVVVAILIHNESGVAVLAEQTQITGQAGYYDELPSGTYRVGQKVEENTWVVYQIIPTGDIPFLMQEVPMDSVRKDGTILKKSPASIY